MATRLFLRHNTSAETTPTTSQSTTMPAGTANPQSWLHKRLLSQAGTGSSPQTGNVTTLAQTARQDARIKPWFGDRLSAQTIAANTWTLAVATYETNANANAFMVAVLYVWRPSTATKVGTIYDATTALGNEFAVGTTYTGRVMTFAGAAVTVMDGDFLLLEVWQTMTQAAATSYITEFAYNGPNVPTEGLTTGMIDAGPYLETPQNLLFGGANPPRRSFNSNQALNRASSF